MKPQGAFPFSNSEQILAVQEEKRSIKVKKGWLAVRVGVDEEADGGCQRFTMPISHLYHPQFARLLERVRELYGFHTAGPLRLPCSVDDFLHLRWEVEMELGGSPSSPCSPTIF